MVENNGIGQKTQISTTNIRSGAMSQQQKGSGDSGGGGGLFADGPRRDSVPDPSGSEVTINVLNFDDM